MSIMASIIIYLMTIIISVYSFYIVEKSQSKVKRIIGIFFAIGIPVFTAGVRYSIGTDYFSYINAFERIRMGYSVRWTDLEHGYVLLNLFLGQLGLGSQSIMFATSLLMMCFTSKALFNKQKEISVWFGALTFFLLFYQSTFNGIRMMIAVSIFLYNIIDIENQKLIKYLFFSALAASFHITAIVTIPLYWIFNSRIIKKSLLSKLVLYLLTGLVIIYFNPIFSRILSTINIPALNYYEKYIGFSSKSIDIAIKKFIMFLPILMPGALFYKKCMEQDKNFYIYYSLMVMGVIIEALAIFKASYVDRFAEYFIISSVIIIPVYLRVFKKKEYFMFITGMIYYLSLYWIYIYFICNNHGTVPYQWIL